MRNDYRQQYGQRFLVLFLFMVIIAGCRNTVKDVEGNKYKTVEIGSQVWMAENLRVSRFNDGTEIPLVSDNNDWAKLSTPAYSWYFNDEKENKNTYGALYNWYAISSDKICPTGWHVPDEEEWEILIFNQDGFMKAGGRLKATGTANWKIPNTDATNQSGFTALPGGYRSFEGVFNYLGNAGYFWCKTFYTEKNVAFWNLRYKSGAIYKYRSEKVCGFSVRCIKNN